MRYQSESSSLGPSSHFSRMKRLTELSSCSLSWKSAVRAGFHSWVKFTKVRLVGRGHDT